MNGHVSLADGLNKRSNHDRIEAELKTSIDIAATGYDLYVAHEFQPKGDAVEALRVAFALCDQG